jgi:DNA repair protein RadC
MKTKSQLNLFTSNLAEIEIFYKNKVRPSDRPKIASSMDAVQQLRLVWSHNMERIEEFMVLVLNRANRILGWARISQGGVSGTVADPKVIFQIALKANASSIIIAHNHPSGNLTPSESDVALTRKMKEAGVLLDLPVLDHLILTSEGYYSFADEGLL